jgi:G3E family GTPase
MKQVDVIAVVGTCGPERSRYAARLAENTARALVPSARLNLEPDPTSAASFVAEWTEQAAGVVIEFPPAVAVTEIIGALAAPEGPTRLVSVICLVDAMHLLKDLFVDDFIASGHNEKGQPQDYIARASLTVTQIEHATMVVLVGWEAIETPELSTLMALLSVLNPSARIRLDQGGTDPIDNSQSCTREHDRAGWVRVLNDNANPHITDPRVSSLHYEQVRPFHPQRLSAVLMKRFEDGEFGQVVRSVGFCRLATHSEQTLQWDHVGRTIAFHLVTTNDDEDTPDDPITLGQDLAFIGLDLDHSKLTTALNEALLTDGEFATGASAWRLYPDPFPSWNPADDLAE